MSSRIVLRAAQMLAHSYHGGAKALSVVIDKKYQTFANELLELSGSKLGLETAVQMSMASGDLAILNAFAEQMDCVVMPRPVAPNLGMPVIQSIADMQTAVAELSQALSRADAKQGNPAATDVKGGRVGKAAGHSTGGSVPSAGRSRQQPPRVGKDAQMMPRIPHSKRATDFFLSANQTPVVRFFLQQICKGNSIAGGQPRCGRLG